jgi:hypothetical protein
MTVASLQHTWLHITDEAYQVIKDGLADCEYMPKPSPLKSDRGEVLWEIHVDHLESLAEQRKELKYGGVLSVRFPAAAKKATSDQPCHYNHHPDVCKCNLPIIHLGQGIVRLSHCTRFPGHALPLLIPYPLFTDESTFKKNLYAALGWTWAGIQLLNKKGPGESIMVRQRRYAC